MLTLMPSLSVKHDRYEHWNDPDYIYWEIISGDVNADGACDILDVIVMQVTLRETRKLPFMTGVC
ncbi:MAG: hypothetical protein K2H29_09685 [Oscillospiraceae bacterium]|nr:hypothetical protein [Oscillospiraceae bacterium]